MEANGAMDGAGMPPSQTCKRENRSDSSVPSPFDRSDALIVSDLYLTTSFGGAAAFYSLRLGQPCASAVVVHLVLPQAHGEAGNGIKLSSDRIFFAPESFAEPQLVRVDCVDDRSATIVIAHKVYSLDKTYDHVHTPNVIVKTVRHGGGRGSFISFGGQMTKRQAAALGGSQAPSRLDLLSPSMGVNTSSSSSSETSPPGSSSSTSLSGGLATLTTTPNPAEPPWYVSHLSSGYHFSLVAVSLPQADTLLSWGANANGELGNGATAAVTEPRPVLTTSMQRLLPGECLRIAQVACGKHHAAVVTRSAHLFTWGNNKHGQLGHGDYATRLVPQEVNLTLGSLTVTSSAHRALRVKHAVKRGGTNVTHVCCGSYHTLFVTHQQQILGMGYNQAGQLGIGHRLQQYKSWRSCTPIAVDGLRDCSVLDVAAGQNHSACVLSNGDVYVWGCGDDGRLGTGDRESVSSPTLLTALRSAKVRARTIRCGARHTAVISDQDLLYVWGANEFGQLGCGDRRTRLKPALVAFPPLLSHGVADVSLGEFHSACITFTGVAYTWGLDLAAESTDIEQRNTPQSIQLPGNQTERVRRVSCGWAHTNLSTQRVSSEDNSGSSNNQPSNFHRKLQREKLQLRRDEIARWRAYVSPGGASMWQQQARFLRHVKGRVSLAMEPGARFDRQVKELVSEIRESNQSPRQNQIIVPQCLEQPRIPHEVVGLKSFVRDYCKQATQDAIDHVQRLMARSTRRRILTSNEMPRHGQRQLRGVFNEVLIQPPSIPDASLDSSAPIRSLPCYTVEIRQATVSTNSIRPCKPASMPRPTSAALISRSSRLSGIAGQYDCGDLVDLLSDTTSEFDCSNSRPWRPQTARSDARSGYTTNSMGSPRRHQHLGVMDSLLHQPSFSITSAVLTPCRAPTTPRR